VEVDGEENFRRHLTRADLTDAEVEEGHHVVMETGVARLSVGEHGDEACPDAPSSSLVQGAC
jgi:hypothetical protein